MQKLESFQNLIENILHMLIGEFLVRLNDLIEIDLHVVCHEIDCAKVMIIIFIVVEHICQLEEIFMD